MSWERKAIKGKGRRSSLYPKMKHRHRMMTHLMTVCVEEESVTPERFLFNPVGASWQEECAAAFSLHTQSSEGQRPSTAGIRHPPIESPCISGDGNCLFRSFSHLLTGAVCPQSHAAGCRWLHGKTHSLIQ